VVRNAKEVHDNWERIKLKEKGNKSVLSGVPNSYPPWSRPTGYRKRPAVSGLTGSTRNRFGKKVKEELQELRENVKNGSDPAKKEDELGDLLFAIINYARFIEVNPEDALERRTGNLSAD